MKKVTVFLLAALTLAGVVFAGQTYDARAQEVPQTPYYFVAIHCEPVSPDRVAEEFSVLREMVAYADAYSIKLTIMFTVPWADYVATDSDLLTEVQGWMVNGHEIAAHHHSIYHGSWDGYTNFPPETVQAQDKRPGAYRGSLDDYIAALRQVNPDIQAGCVNDEHDKQVMPDAIIYDTCSGFANTGTVGERFSDNVPEKGINRFVLVGTVNDIPRKWLAHYQVYQNPRAAIETMLRMDGGVYGVVTHATAGQDPPLYAFLDAVHAVDPEGTLSRTVSAIMEEALLPEVTLPDEVINAVYEQNGRPPVSGNGYGPGNQKCGDGVCDQVERAHPDLCPQDCLQSP